MSEEDPVTGADLTGDTYEVEQSLVRNKYAVYDGHGDLVLRAKQKLLKMKEEFPFVDADGDPVFTVKAANVLDIAGDYAVVDERTGETVVNLRKNFTFFVHSWTIENPGGGVIAEVRSGSKILEGLRSFSFIAGLVPHDYDITREDGTQIGKIEGQFSVRDRYTLTLHDTEGIPKEALVAGAIAIDALEGN